METSRLETCASLAVEGSIPLPSVIGDMVKMVITDLSYGSVPGSIPDIAIKIEGKGYTKSYDLILIKLGVYIRS